MSREEIQSITIERKIPFLVHFTRSENVQSIIQHGLLPVADARARGLLPVVNDQERLDGRLNGTSVSIAFPNGKLFYRFRKDNPETEWVVLAIAPSILWSKRVLFCKHNAADLKVSQIASADLETPAAFRSMFEEIDEFESRAEQGIKDCDPTDVQAEALVMEAIEPEFIIGALVNSEAQKVANQAFLGKRKILVHEGRKGVFANRTYYRKFGGG